jgi:bifunctional N-acetylglucosamine-1-phosphate-uridyltransferase/glucosamine-1-phosphate-acetyltransferase GlmU-like protein
VTWRAVVLALDDGEALRSRVSVYRHPLAGRPVLWHVLTALCEVEPPPEHITVLHRRSVALAAGEGWPPVSFAAVDAGDEARALRAELAAGCTQVLVDGAAPLLSAGTIARLVGAGATGAATLAVGRGRADWVAVAADGALLAAAADARLPDGPARVTTAAALELLRVTDRHTLGEASVAMRDRLVRDHEAAGVSFLLPATSWVDVGVRIGADTVIYPGVVLEGATVIAGECVIGPHSRVVESTIGRGVELRGWNYVTRTSVRNHAVLEPYERRGFD